MGEVWSARDLRLGRDVAVKLLSPQMAAPEGVRERFEAEARSAARLNHPNVVSVYDTGEHDGVPYLVMELLPGKTLADELATGPFSPERVRAVGVQILAALGASHRAGILHRDIKPGNVMVASDGTVKVGDFGIAKSVDGLHLTTLGMIVGTVGYLAPERLEGHPATPQSDLYAVGVVLYEALTGRMPYQADTPLGLVRAIEGGAPALLAEAAPAVDAALAGTVERAMAKDPDRRFATAVDMAAALQSQPADTVTLGTYAPTVSVTPVPAATQALDAASAPVADSAVADRAAGNPGIGIRDRWLALEHRTGIIVGLSIAVAVVLLVVLVAGRLGGSSTSPRHDGTPTASVPVTGGSLPPRIEEPLKRLEKAVHP
jgi:serine/threonine-protein kinase